METWQNVAKPENAQEVAARDKAAADASLLSGQQQLWIDYNALGGLITDLMQEDDYGKPQALKRMSISDFAKLIGVNRETLRRWRVDIPDFWKKVNDRRIELSSTSRLQQMHDVWYRSALLVGKDGFRDRQAWLKNFMPGYKAISDKEKDGTGNSWAALINSKRDELEANAIEGEVISDVPDQV